MPFTPHKTCCRPPIGPLFFVGEPHMSDVGFAKPVLCRNGVGKAMRSPGGLPTTALTPLAFTWPVGVI